MARAMKGFAIGWLDRIPNRQGFAGISNPRTRKSVDMDSFRSRFALSKTAHEISAPLRNIQRDVFRANDSRIFA
jgi:hypothetical protein